MVASRIVTEFTVKGADKVIQALNTQQNKIKESTGTTTKGMVALSAAISGVVTVARGLQGISRYMQEGMVAAREYTKQMALLELSLSRMSDLEAPMEFGAAVQHMEALFENSTLARGEIVRIQAALSRTTKDAEVLMKATQATVDLMAARPEMGAAGAAQWITTLLGDPSRTMDKFRRAEIQVTAEFQKQMEFLVEQGRIREAQLLTIYELTQRVGGAAEVAANTVGGRWDKIEQQSTDFMRRLATIFGETLLPVVEELWKEDRVERFLRVAEKLQPIIKEFGDYLVDALDTALNFSERLVDVLERMVGPLEKTGDTLEGIVRFASPLDPMTLRPIKAAGEFVMGGIESGSMEEGFNRAVNAMFNAKTAAEKEAEAKRGATKASESHAEAMAKEQEKLLRVEAARKQMTVEQYQNYLFRQAREEEMEEQMKKVSAEADRMAARLGTISNNMDSPIQKLERYNAMLQEYRETVTQLEDAERRLAWARELESKIVQDFIQKMKQPLDNISKKYAGKNNPFLQIQEDLVTLLKGDQWMPDEEKLAALRNMLEHVQIEALKLAPEDDPFSSVSAGVDNLYQTIRDAFLEEDDPTVEAIEKQTEAQRKFLETLAKRIEDAIRIVSGRGGVPVNVEDPRWATDPYRKGIGDSKTSEVLPFTKESAGYGMRFIESAATPFIETFAKPFVEEIKEAIPDEKERSQETEPVEKELKTQTKRLDASNMAAAALVVEAIENIDVGMTE